MHNLPEFPDGTAPLNLSISAYRVLYILLMLVRYRSLNMVELNNLLTENPLIARVYNSETLTKYINTLREVGCHIPRSSNRNDYSYELLKSPFPFDLTMEEMAISERLLSLLALQPDEVLYQDYRDFIEQLFWAVSTDGLESTEEIVFSKIPELSRRREQMKEYRRYCQDAFALELVHEENGEQIDLLLEPYEVIERDKRIFLLGLDRKQQQQRMLDVDQIVSVRQLPTKNRRMVSQVTVVFVLSGRLANSYRLYPAERIVYRTDQEIHVKSRVPETSGLIQRLLKYGTSCQILSPDSFKDSMRRHIKHLLNTLDDQTAS